MPYTTNKKFSTQTAGTNSGTWGAGGTTGEDLNTGVVGPIDAALAGIATFSVASSPVSLTFVAGGTGSVQQAMWRFTGALLSAVDCTPAGGDATTYFNGFYYFENLTTGSFALTVTTAAGTCTLPQGRRGCMFVDVTNGPRVVGLVGSGTADPVPVGSKTIWYNTAAPSGWTAVALNDYGIKIVTTGSGGVTSGSVAYSTFFGRTATDGYTLLTADIPSHNHTVAPVTGTTVAYTASGTVAGSGSALTTTTLTVGNTGGGGSHTHPLDARVNTAAFTLCSRD